MTLLSGISYISKLKSITIASINFEGNLSVKSSDLKAFVSSALNGSYGHILAKSNSLIYPKGDLKNKLLNNFTRIKNVELKLKDFQTLNVLITERKPVALWCDQKCYFLDEEGFVFDEAPQISGSVYTHYHGFISDENIIGKTFLNSSDFKDLSHFVSNLKNEQINITDIFYKQEQEFEAVVEGGGKILFNKKTSFENTLENLNSVLEDYKVENKNGDFFKNLDYVDLRFGNKIYYKKH